MAGILASLVQKFCKKIAPYYKGGRIPLIAAPAPPGLPSPLRAGAPRNAPNLFRVLDATDRKLVVVFVVQGCVVADEYPHVVRTAGISIPSRTPEACVGAFVAVIHNVAKVVASRQNGKGISIRTIDIFSFIIIPAASGLEHSARR